MSEGPTGARIRELRVFGHDLIVVSRPVPVPPARLGSAELEVAKLVAAGLSNAEIAALRGRSERTIANQIASILRKLCADSRHHIGRLLGPGPAEGRG